MVERACLVCGCTENNACFDELRGACWWKTVNLCSHCVQPDARLALASLAVEPLAEAAAELARFSREGNQESFEPFALNPAKHVAEALQLILRIERASVIDAAKVGETYPDHNQLLGALERFLEGQL